MIPLEKLHFVITKDIRQIETIEHSRKLTQNEINKRFIVIQCK